MVSSLGLLAFNSFRLNVLFSNAQMLPLLGFARVVLPLVLLLLDAHRVRPGHQVPRVHVPVHAHGDAFLESS